IGPLPAPGVILLATFAYVIFASASAEVAQRRGSIPEWLVFATMMSDVAFVFALSISVSAPQYYDRALIFSFFALHLNTLYFGRKHAAFVLAAVAAGYLALIGSAMGTTTLLSWREEIMTVAVFLLASAVLLVEYDAIRGQMASMVLTDPLTACMNRRGFDEALLREVARCDRVGGDVALIALDIDHFKFINDSLGHLAGDAVLRDIAVLLQREARAGDVVARVGGEEFSFILPDTSVEGAFQLGKRVRDAVRQHRFGGESSMRLTVSVGVASMRILIGGRAPDAAEVLVSHADEALYAAKRAGRDRVEAWASEEFQSVPAGALTSSHAEPSAVVRTGAPRQLQEKSDRRHPRSAV
ncbi:MAG TPA: GGDEF domain-containing protein, partial [Gemmatimonadaceae bacterium]|nr:GGDEF domain-containing protein [Gemmatimonadaceae bacterium]